MKKQLLLGLLVVPCFYATAQTISIPDPIFEQVLIDQEIDSDGIVNGQITAIDALEVVSLTITSPNSTQNEYIQDLTGIEGFTNLENLTVNTTKIEELNVTNLTKLKHLDCMDNLLTGIDVSSNLLLEFLDITSSGDVGPINNITQVDLSHNPNIKQLRAIGPISYINLKNGNNNPDMSLIIYYSVMGGGSPDEIYGHTCIEVDDANAAQNNQSPYSSWLISHSNKTYSLVANCSLDTKDFNTSTLSVYPNPTSDILYFQTTEGATINETIVFDISGRIVKEYNNSTDSISLADLQTGTYIVKLVSDKGTFTQKVVKQ